ncbi:3-hydroxyacyl-CoA dehydrogenase, NAD binding [Dillenia turbinata]|uniref:3-hydroxyacyl-CoA dehydrogenase, NAD binding n=1 Tax=Dillenia turbinata TaxID=194707 RepID=A0AAN8W3F3_9MAGN
MMLTSKIVKGEEAYSLGLVDAIAPTSELVNRARSWALCILEQKKPWISSLYKLDKLEPLAKARVICTSARARAKKQSPNVEFPLACVDVIEEGIVSGPRAGLWKEAKTNEELQHSITSKSLVHIFFAQRATTKVPGVTDQGLQPRKVYKVAVVGGGLMGSGIATALILHNYPVILKEVNEQFLQAGIGRVKANLQSRAKDGKMSLEKLDKTFSLLRGVLEYDSFRDVDLVIEAITEDILLKQQIFADLEKYCPPHCVLASNTSTFDLNLVGKKTNVHSQIVGAHFFSPAHVRPLLEIIRTEQTSAQAVLDLIYLAKSIKKTAIIVKNSTGFATTRMMFPYSMAATFFVERGSDIYKIDQAISKFGMPMGPFRMADLVGFGVATGARANMRKSFSERWYDSRLMQVMQEDGRAGQTTGKGFYVYDSNRKAFPDPEIEKYIEKTRRISGISIDPKLKSLSEKEIVEMLFFPVVNESCRILAEGIAIKASDLDIASVMGFGFPAYRGGMMFWADSIGPKYICSKLDEWSRIYSKIFEPSAYLKERASRDIPLGAPPEEASSRL